MEKNRQIVWRFFYYCAIISYRILIIYFCKNKMFKKNLNVKILLLVMVLLVSSGFGCRGASEIEKKLKPVSLEFWGVWDDSTVFSGFINEYVRSHPNVTINYKKLRYDEYERMLLDAWAGGRGPDIFSLHNTWIPGYREKISVMPRSTTVPYVTYQAPLPGCKRKTEEVLGSKTTVAPSLTSIRDDYVSTVAKDVMFKDEKGINRIYALPLALDTLTLFYNRNLLDSANIPFPPATWDEFREDVRLLTRLDANKNIIQSGVAMGTFNNIDRAFDIISLLIMQNGGHLDNLQHERSLEALNFYLDFSSPYKEVYSWNDNMPNSLDAFIEGRTAFFFGYSYHVPMIKAKAPALNFSVATVPQLSLERPINYSNYWTNSIYKNSKNQKEAWDFLLFLNQKRNIKKYLETTKKPTALRDLIEWQSKDIKMEPFVLQVLSADNWHNLTNFNYVEESMRDMLNIITTNRIAAIEAEKEDDNISGYIEDMAKKIRRAQ